MPIILGVPKPGRTKLCRINLQAEGKSDRIVPKRVNSSLSVFQSHSLGSGLLIKGKMEDLASMWIIRTPGAVFSQLTKYLRQIFAFILSECIGQCG